MSTFHTNLKISSIHVASDHAGFELKSHLIKSLPELPWKNLGPNSADRVDYPDFADLAIKGVDIDQGHWAVLVCGSGQGMSLRANKYPHIRAALCWDEEITELSRAHNNANVLCLGSRFLSPSEAVNIVKKFFSTEFEAGRHTGRVEKINKPV